MSSPLSGSPGGSSSPSQRRGKKKQETEEQERKHQHRKKHHHHQGKQLLQGKTQKGKSSQQPHSGGEFAAAAEVPVSQRRFEKEEAEKEEEAAAVLGAAAAMVAAADAALELEDEEEELQRNRRKETFELYNKQLTTQMTFDEQGTPILAPLSKLVAPDAGFLVTTMTAASDDTEGQIEAVPPPQGPCAGLCPPYGALPERMPLQDAGGEKRLREKESNVSITAPGVAAALAEATAAGAEVIQEAGELYIRKRMQDTFSFYALPSKNVVRMPHSEERDCPVPLWQLLPPSPFVNESGEIGVDIYAVRKDLGVGEFEDAIPAYDLTSYADEESAVADFEQQSPWKSKNDEIFLKRRSTLYESVCRPASIRLD